jgi:hypothetical protein
LELGNGVLVQMALATKEHVAQWRLHMTKNPEQGCNFGNIGYADTRLALWAEEKTLAELETVLSTGR